MKKICFVTGTRADYGILAPVMREIANHADVALQIVATNMHLSPNFGMTVNEIEADGFKVDSKISSLMPGASAEATVLSMAKVQEGLAKTFSELMPDLVVILGDRYEALAAAAAAVVFNIPVAHLHGGEVTLGAFDDMFRNAITKLSTYHFAATPQYADNIISMGANPESVFHSGAPGAEITLEQIHYYEQNLKPLLAEFQEKTGLNPAHPYILLAFHPVTLSPDKGLHELKATLGALDIFISEGYNILTTMPNSDPGNDFISETIIDWAARYPDKVKTVSSLGARLFRFAMEHASAIIGNSSAALIEAPSFRLGAVNVGERQKGRVHGCSVIDAKADILSITQALRAVTSLEMKAVLMGMTLSQLNPYYKENAASFIAKTLIEKLK